MQSADKNFKIGHVTETIEGGVKTITTYTTYTMVDGEVVDKHVQKKTETIGGTSRLKTGGKTSAENASSR